MRDDDLRARLTASNPWWRAALAGSDRTAWASRDRLLRDKQERDIGFRATILDDVASTPVTDALILLRGPRRVGKSVTLRELAQSLCSRDDIDPRQVISFSCDGMTAQDLTRGFTLARELTKTVDQPAPRRRVWLVDEVGQVRGWTARLKLLRDDTALGDETVVATSSSWRSDEDVEGNLLAGRAGSSGLRRVRLLMPMSFRDFVTCTRPDLGAPTVRHPADLQAATVAGELDGYHFDLDAYDLCWQSYLTCGGFPRSVAHSQRTGSVEPDFVKDLAAWLRTDVDRDAPAESIPILLEGLAARGASPLNISKAGEDLGYRSRDIFERRLHRLVNAFGALWVPKRSDGGRAVPQAQPKLILTDPLLGWLPVHLREGCAAPAFTKLSEQVLCVALARVVDSLEEGRWIANDTIGYAGTDSGNEVDLSPVRVPGHGEGSWTVPIESKWVSAGWKPDSRVIHGKYGRGILATKTVLDTNGPVWAIPAPLLALMLG